MNTDGDHTRRRLLRAAGLTVATGALSGCLDESTTNAGTDGPTDGEDDDDDSGSGDGADDDDRSSAVGADGDAASDDNDGTIDDDSDTDSEAGETEPTETGCEYEINPERRSCSAGRPPNGAASSRPRSMG
ncbi:hypothetical protein ACERIM_08315 [Natrinema sp. H-ect1]|uniref:hypothetical protein n=1 Tax=Natrinema sp. H-ect1 TaxID=3242700 RepID=UPI00359DA282